jgi:integrase
MSSPRIPFLPGEEARVLEALRGFSARDQCFILLGLHTGFRASELGAISIGHVWDGAAVRHEISLARRNLKGGRGLRRRSVRARTLPLNAAARTAIGNYLRDRLVRRESLRPDEALFRSRKTGRGLSRWQLNVILHRVIVAAGLPPDGRYGCHTLRKTFARKVHRALGGDINLTREALGHRHVTTTQAYLEPDPVRVRSAILAMGRPEAEPELPLVGDSGYRCGAAAADRR